MAAKTSKTSNKKTHKRLTLANRRALYAARRYISRSTEEALDLRIPFAVRFKDPLVAKTNPALDFDKDFMVPWEPGLTSGPTSARFAVVDYDGTANVVKPPAKWDRRKNTYLDGNGKELSTDRSESPQFHQVSVWATLQHTLDHFESGFGLGRSIGWGFEGNRLIVVPHAGYGENAFYDRNSKSLQFYYFDSGGKRIYTCDSSDIVNHEFGHAVLDGIRPHFFESVSPETAAFHEFFGDMTAILMAFRNNDFRKAICKMTRGDLSADENLASIARQFGEAVEKQPYLRTAKNKKTMADMKGELRPHELSQVLTGAMFDLILRISKQYIERGQSGGKRISPADAFWDTIQRVQRMAIHPLDLLPPVEVTFRDYALAVLRAEEVAGPTDPHGFRPMTIDVFIKRGILDKNDKAELMQPHQVFERLNVRVFHEAALLASSRAEAYRFIDDNRPQLLVPDNVDVIVSDVFSARKLTREARRLPRQILIQYIWREDVLLNGARFGEFAGRTTSMLCGATLALDENGNVIAWARKPGTQLVGKSDRVHKEQAEGERRRQAFLDTLAARISAGMIGQAAGGALGLLAKSIAPFASRDVDGQVRFELSPHLALHDDETASMGGRQWQISS